MKSNTRVQRIVTGALVATLAMSAFASAALADHGKKGKHRRAGYAYAQRRDDCGRPAYYGGGRYDRGYAQPSFVVRASFVAANRHADRGVYFEDPWTNETYTSLDAYRSQCRGHWPIARVIDARSGAWVQTVCWHDGAWQDYDASDPPWERDRACANGWDE